MVKFKKIYHLKTKEKIEFECDTEETWDEVITKFSNYIGTPRSINVEKVNNESKILILPVENIDYMELIKDENEQYQ